MNYQAPWWLPGGNAQTIWAALYAARYQGSKPQFTRARWTTPDDDFIDVDFLADASDRASPTLSPGAAQPPQPMVVVFHGLEGSSSSHYAEAFAGVARSRHWS